MKKDQERERKGIRKLWRTGRLIHVSQVRREIAASVGWDKTESIRVERNFKRRNGKYIMVV